MTKVFWRSSKVAVIGGGSWGTVLAHLISDNCSEVRVWVRSEKVAREINSTRVNHKYVPNLTLNENVKAFTDFERLFDSKIGVIVWSLPSGVCRERAREMSKFLNGTELVIHATKGIEQGSLKRISEILCEELPLRRVGALSGPNLATEIARREPAATVVASHYDEVIESGVELFSSNRFRVFSGKDVIGVEWAGTLKNVLSIASGCLDAMNLGWNARAFLLSRGLIEMVRFGVAMGAKEQTFLGLAGMGDLLATCSSPLSRNYQVGYALGEGKEIGKTLQELGSTAEGVRTAQSVWSFAQEKKIDMPITSGVFRLIGAEISPSELLEDLMAKAPSSREIY